MLTAALVSFVVFLLKLKKPGPINAGEVSQSWLVAHRSDMYNADRWAWRNVGLVASVLKLKPLGQAVATPHERWDSWDNQEETFVVPAVPLT